MASCRPVRRRDFALITAEALASLVAGCAPPALSPRPSPRDAPAPRSPEAEAGNALPGEPPMPAGDEPSRPPSLPDREGSEGALYQRFPALGRALPRARLLDGPSPIEPAPALGEALSLPRLFVKRDDRAGLLYGGNKTRKLELELGRALADGDREVVTTGAVGSNHALATALYARHLGLRATLRLLPQPPTDDVRKHLLAMVAAGATLTEGRASGRGAKRPAVRDIATGGSSPLGNIGYVAAAFELASQIEAGLLPEPDVVYVAFGTMGCAVGLALGLAAAGLKTVVRAVQVSSPAASSPRLRDRMARDTVALARSLDPCFPEVTAGDDRAPVVTGYVGPGYGLPTPRAREAVALYARTHGGELETTYTGKALAALVDEAPSLREKVVVFWNTYNSRQLELASPSQVPERFRGYF